MDWRRWEIFGDQVKFQLTNFPLCVEKSSSLESVYSWFSLLRSNWWNHNCGAGDICDSISVQKNHEIIRVAPERRLRIHRTRLCHCDIFHKLFVIQLDTLRKKEDSAGTNGWRIVQWDFWYELWRLEDELGRQVCWTFGGNPKEMYGFHHQLHDFPNDRKRSSIFSEFAGFNENCWMLLSIKFLLDWKVVPRLREGENMKQSNKHSMK